MKHFKVYLILFFLICRATYGSAQESKLFTADNELSSSLINDLFQETSGVIWIATEDGLNRYDGAKFTLFRNNPDDSGSLADNNVRVIYEDSCKNILIGTVGGLQRYDRATERFLNVPLYFNNPNRDRVNASVGCLLQRRNGEVLVGTSGHNLFKLELQGDTLIGVQQASQIGSYIIHLLYEDRHGNLWVGTEDNGIYCIDPSDRVKHFTVEMYAGFNSISAICEKEGTLYLGSLTHGLYRYDEANDRMQAIVYTPYPHLPIKTLYAGDNRKLLIGTDGHGLKVYDTQKGTITDHLFNISSFSPRQTKIHAILEDKAHNLWYGLYQKGVMLIPATDSRFQYIGYKSSDRNIIGSACVMAVCKDHNGTLWVGTDNDGLYAIAPNGSRQAHYSPASNAEHAAPATVMSIFEDSSHTLWVGSYLQGLAYLDQTSGRFHYVTLPDAQGKPVPNVYAFAEDNLHNLWVGTMGGGLFRIDTRTKKVTGTFAVRNDNTLNWGENNSLHNSWINCLLYSRSGLLYIGTFDGIGCLDPADMNFITANGRRWLAGEVVYALHEDIKGQIWIGTANGLKCFNPHIGRTQHFTRKDGLPNELICGIEEDHEGTLWISTGYGISRLNPNIRTAVNYYAADGLQGNEFSKRASFATMQGEIIFGGTGGVTLFRPEEIQSPHLKPEIHITDFYVHNRAVKKGMLSDEKEIIDTAVPDADLFRLGHKDNTFSIEVSAMEFYSPQHITYQYALNNDTWNNLQPGSNSISFSDLQAGTYYFRFRSQFYTAVSDIKKITVIVSPAWYASGWARIVYMLLGLALLYAIIAYVQQRIRTRQERLEHRHAEQINEAKLQFFINISHEIRTPMSLIISPLQKLLTNDTNEGRQKEYRTMFRNAERILNLVNQLMDVRKIEKGQMRLHFRRVNMADFIRDIYGVFEQQAEAKQIALNFVPDAEETETWIDPKNFDKVLMNVLSNALKFTPKGGSVTTYLRTGTDFDAPTGALQHYLEIVVEDTGTGIPPEDRERIFERFYQVHTPTNTSAMGTGVGLHLCRSLVQLHYGTIQALSGEDGTGTRLVIRLPMGNAHLSADEIDTEVETPTVPEANIPPPMPLPVEEEVTSTHRHGIRYNVMVVEDDEEIRQYIMRELQSDFNIQSYSDGKSALTAMLQQTPPDLIISDIMMPEMDGLTLCRKIRQNANINHIPVILLTARIREEDEAEGMDMGADAYITKPFQIERLRKQVKNLINNRHILRVNFSGNQLQEDKLEKLESMNPDEIFMERVMKIVNRHLGDPALSVDMLAGEVGISRTHLYRKIKEMTGYTIRDFIRNVRLKQAALLLKEKRQNISDVATRTGFVSMSYFSTCFKDIYGVSPVNYMTQVKREQEEQSEEEEAN
ncbi:MAG: response regulator [Mediterranea sp.]|jgi:signal transduction histidine kinase/ligand-binding sensor domain-containing protein/CheY-like chemotaxis protein|nr:response regulator [Mediterranea sp.]